VVGVRSDERVGAQEEHLERPHGIRDVDLAVVGRVGRVEAGRRWTAEKEKLESVNRVAEVDVVRAVDVAADELDTSPMISRRPLMRNIDGSSSGRQTASGS